MNLSKTGLLALIEEANALLTDASIFTIHSINNPEDGIFDKIPGKGYYLTALAALLALGFYSRIYYALVSKHNRKLTLEQENKRLQIINLIKVNKLESFFVMKNPTSILSSEEDCFYKLMFDLKKEGLDLGIGEKEYKLAWKQVRNMLSHLTFSLVPIGGRHINKENKRAIDMFELPIYDPIKVMEIIRSGFDSSDAFKIVDNKLTVNSTVLIAYMIKIKQFLIDTIEDSSESKCESALNDIRSIVHRQYK